MADKTRIKKAVRVQAASAQVEAELNALSKMALDLSHQLEQIKRQQADLLNVAVDQGLPNDFSSAVELNPAVVPSTTIKLVRCNVMWFLQYNLLDNYSLACLIDWFVLILIIAAYNIFVDLLASIIFAILIKFYTQYNDEMQYLDELAPIGRELRYPGVMPLTKPFYIRMRFPHRYSFDLFSSSENRAKFLDWQRVNHNFRRVLLSNGRPAAFEEILPLIKCRKHSLNGIQNIAINNGYFAYEWLDDKLALYLTAHVVQVNTQYMRRIYGDVYASTYKKPALSAIDGDTPKGPVSSGYVQGVVDDQMLKGLSGWTLSSGSHFYVVHASQGGKLASYARAEKPLAPFEVNYACPVCTTEAHSICVAGPSGLQSSESVSSRKEQKRRAPLGNIDVVEHIDAWGVRYDLYREGVRSGLVCKDIRIWAAHVSDRDNGEILPDIITEGENFRPYAPTEEYKLVYTSFAQERIYSFIYSRQIFMMFNEDLLVLIEAPVFRTKHKLVSGTLIYVWYKGICPNKQNFKVVSVVTVGRMINGYYYYPIINDSCNICEFRSRKSVRHLGYVDRVEYQKMRQLCSTNAIVHNYELARFSRRNLFRLLSEDNKIVASFEFDNDLEYDPFDWEYHVSCEGSLLLLKQNQVQGVSSTLSDYIDQFDTTSSFCSSIVNADRKISEPIRIPVISLALVDELPDSYQFTIYLRKNSTDNIIYSSGKFVILGQSTTLVDLIRSFVRTLWMHGVELIVIRGDLYELVGNSEISPYDFFAGCETRQTPTLIFAADNESLLVDLRQWLQAELETSELEALISIHDLVIHPDWTSGSIALAPTAKHSLTQRSLAEWRSHARYPLEEIDFTSGNWAPMDCESVPELLEISNEDYWVGELQCFTSRGSCVGFENTLLTSRHVTRGASIKIHRRGYNYEWKKPFLDGKQEDLCIYGSSLPKVARVSKGEILCVICPFRRIGHFLIVTEEDSQLETRPGAKFNSMRPIIIDEHFTKWAPSGWKGQAGMSGCPIFNSSGKLVSIYGLGKIESVDLRFESMDIKIPRVQTALTVMAPDIRPEIVPDAFFRTAATEVVTQRYESPSTYFLCKAPTGTGKTLYFTKNLMQLIPENQRVILLQPTVSAVKGAFRRISELLDMSSQGHNHYTLRYLIGQRNENVSETIGSGNKQLTLMTYGRAIVDLQTIQTSYDYILLDEIHNLNDPTVLACDLALTKPNVTYKCVHLSATISSDIRATLLASNMVIEGTRFKIDETIHIEPINGSESGDFLLIPKGTMGINIGGFEKGFKIPMGTVEKGRVIFFLASRADCEKMVAYCARNYAGSRQYLAIHAGTTIDLNTIRNDCWMFCTDVVGQSITIPGCHVVVDFLEEIKTTTKLYHNRLGIVYNSALARRRIDIFTAQQRKGRTGRTNPGWYVTPVGHSPVIDNGVDIRSVAEATLRLRWSGIYSKFSVKDYYSDRILKDIMSIEWILPENLIELNVWNAAIDSLSARHSKVLSKNMNDKLKLVIGANGDLLYLYLTPIISSELIDKSISDQTWSRTGSPSTDREFYKRLEEYCIVVETEQLRENALVEHQLAISSDKEKVNLSLDLTLELRAMLDVDYESAGCSQHTTEQEDSVVCTTMVIAAASCTLLTGIYWWMETTCQRSVTRAASISKDQVVPACKFYTTETRILENYSGDKKSALSYIKENIETAVSWLAKIGVDKEKRHSASLIAMLTEKLEYSFSLIPASWHLGLVPSLAASFGAAIVGSWYVSLEEVLGATLATALMICLNGGLAVITPLPTVISCLVIEIVAFIISAIANRRSNLYDRYGRSMSYPAKAWRFIFGGVSGVALGHMIVAPMLATRPVVTHLCSNSSLTSPLGPNMGKSGLAINVVKQIYVTLVRIQSNQVGVEVLGPILTSAFSMLALDTTTIVVGVVIVLGLIAIRKAIEHAKYAVGSVAKSTRSADGRNPYIEDYFGDFDDIALTVLSSAAVFSNPTSAISILVSWLNTASRTGRLTGGSFKESFHIYSGVPIAFTIITEGIKWISTWQNIGEVNHSVLSNLLITIPTALAGVFGSVYYIGKPEVKDILEKTWNFMRDSLMGLVRMIISVVKTVTRASIKWIGRQIGEGMMQNLPSWLRPTLDENSEAMMLSEVFSATCPEPEEIGVWIRNRWKGNNGLTLLERLHLSTNISSKIHSGSIPPSSYRSYIKNTGQGVSFIWKGDIKVPFALTKISSLEVNAILGHFTLETNVDAGVISMDRNGCRILTEMAYNVDVSVSWFQVSSAISTFGFLVVCYPESDHTAVIVIGYKITSHLMKNILSNLVDVHPVICQLSNLEETSDIRDISHQLDSRLDFRRHQIDLKWQPFRTTLLLGAVNLYSNLTQTFTRDILSNRFSSGGLPDSWFECPPELSLEYWRVLAYYIFASYEAGVLAKEFNVPQCGRDLPLQVYSRSSVQWRKIPSGLQESMEDSSRHIIMKMQPTQCITIVKKILANRTARDSMHDGVSSELTLDKSLNYKNQWVSLAYWQSCTVVYKNQNQDWICTLGGHCKCLVYLDVDLALVNIYSCQDHSFKVIDDADKSPPWNSYLSRGPKASNELVQRVNSLLCRWNDQTGRVAKVGKSTLPYPEQLTKGFVETLSSSFSCDDVQHSTSLFAEAYDQFMSLLSTKPITIGTIVTTALQQLSDASLPMDESDDDDDIYLDSLESAESYIIGWDQPITTQRPRWNWLRSVHSGRVHKTDVRQRDIERQSARVNSMGSRLSFKDWEKIKSSGRVDLPKRSTEQLGSFVSRAGMKMQQLWEADPDFWEDNKIYLDPTCGYGGFVEFLATKLSKGKPRQFIASTLFEKGHRIIDPRITTFRSNLRPIVATTLDHDDKGNIKDPRCISRIADIAKSCGGVDLLILDAGEFSSSLKVNKQFWLQELNGVSFLDATLRLIKLINKGGKICVKMNGVWDGIFEVIHSITVNFREVKTIKLGTTHYGSPEFYILGRGYNPNKRASATRTQHLVNLVMDATYDSYLTFTKILTHKGRGMKPIIRYDWYSPIERAGTIRILDSPSSLPPPVSIRCGSVEYHWDPKWAERIKNFKRLVHLKGLKWLSKSNVAFKKINPIGAIARKRTSHPMKNIENGLISDFMKDVFSLTLTNSTFCHTQSTDKWKEASQIKRLDVDPGHMDPASFAKLIEAFELTDSTYGKKLYGNCKLLSESEVLNSINYQGATGILDEGHTLREYVEKNPNWYDESLKQIDKWQRGLDGGTYFTCRPKNEPKKKKNSDRGKLTNKPGTAIEELEEYNEQGHRFIQFADAKSRLSHYILIGDLINKANKTKIYKGTINGTPVMRQGNVLKALWDRNLVADRRDIVPQFEDRYGVWIKEKRKIDLDEKVTAVCLDYSSWDTSVTVEERLLEATWISKFYPEQIRPAVINACMEMAYPIVTDDDGEVWVRSGQRGSGELLTSMGNTKLVVCNTLVGISECTGIPLDELFFFFRTHALNIDT